jgi:hypothetical protein
MLFASALLFSLELKVAGLELKRLPVESGES